MQRILSWQNASHWRLTLQWLFFGWCLFLGIQFGLFVHHFETAGRAAYFPRPPGVEGFLPIGSLVSLKSWLFTGYFDTVHPAALVLFLTFLVMALLTRKSFCSFICPVGTVSEGAWKLGRKLFGRNFRVWRGLDLFLQFTKYALLFFFAKLILIDMPVFALKEFLAAPYWAIADVKMLHFFTRMSTTSMVVIGVLSLLSVLYRNFWCRYLCPYGALLGLLGMLSPFKVTRSPARCTDCGACSRNCPALIDVQHKIRIHSPECSGCLTCVSNCPEQGALAMAFWKRPVPAVMFVVIVMLIFSGGVLAGKLGGHWQTELTYADYQRLI
ncbi:MAG TPA: 4Fe-4S binding protein, partial [Thioalkalivibrio sp.]|nr:4Fe-4S binding protein [Thioalkalivibrio sp.]